MAVVVVLLTACLTLLGMALSWTQVRSADWRGAVAVALLLPYAGANWLVLRLFHVEHLSYGMNHMALALGMLGQLLYGLAIFNFAQWTLRAFRRLKSTRPAAGS